jgi:hypothetical protein
MHRPLLPPVVFWYSFLEAESTPDQVIPSVASEKKSPATPLGINHETLRLVAQSLNHYATPGPTSYINYVILNVYFVLAALDIAVLRIYAACIMTSLEMAGVQVSVLKVSGTHKEEWLNYLDAETKACAWFGSPLSIPLAYPVKDTPPPESVPVEFEVGTV